MALVTSLVLALSLAGPALACEPSPGRVLWTQPQADQAEVPPDTVLHALVGDGSSAPGDFSLSLSQGGAPVDFTLSSTSWAASGTEDQEILYTLVPTEGLKPGAAYRLEVLLTGGEEARGARLTFTTGEAAAAQDPVAPTVTVLSAEDTVGAGAEGCDWDQVRTFEVHVDPGQADPSGLSLVTLARTDEARTTLHTVAVLPVDAAGSDSTLALRSDRARDWGRCVVATITDRSGGEGPDSALSCAPDPLVASPAGDDTGRPPLGGTRSCRGCATSAGPPAAWLPAALLGGLLLARRRRRG